ncbi:zinc-binding dehydrogenase [Nonomuraea sp. NPDC049309]|uniref:zinc-binding dehydrogenase n=1 Tax=Nonomuraea sp. NPDC049309 TaxID=3364350 RepID=UPI0037241B37
MSEVMRAAAVAESGGPEVLTVMEPPAPQAGPGEVRVRVRAAGVQPFDTAVRQGWLPAWMGEMPYPRIPGNAFAGVIDQVRALAPGGVHAALDGAGGHALDVSLELVADRQRIVTLVEHGKADALGVRLVRGERSAERLGRYARLYAEGEFAWPVRRTYRLEEAAGAHREVEGRHGAGKVVLTI